jgi:hypothetical protein
MERDDFMPRTMRAFFRRAGAERLLRVPVGSFLALALLSACGGGGSSSTPTAPGAPSPGTPSSVLVASTSAGWFSPTAYMSDNDILVFDSPGPYTGSGSFTTFITDPFIINVSIPVPPSVPDVVSASFYAGGSAPYAPASGSIIGYLQMTVGPQTLTPPAGHYYELGTNYQVTLIDPLNIPDGKYVYCTVYAGSQLVGSGSNAKIENGQDTQPGFVCDTANHGNSVTGAPGFKIAAFQPGLVYTIVYSVGQ